MMFSARDRPAKYLRPVEIDHAPFTIDAGFVGFELIDSRFPFDFSFATFLNAFGQLLVLNQQQFSVEFLLQAVIRVHAVRTSEESLTAD